MKKMIIAIAAVVFSAVGIADIKVSDVNVFSGYPWRKVMIGYTITGTDSSADLIRVTATDKTKNKTYTAASLVGAGLTEGRHEAQWLAQKEGVRFTSENLDFSVSVVSHGVQLWENGPYWAECNIGAAKPEDKGYYFKWGDSTGLEYGVFSLNVYGWYYVDSSVECADYLGGSFFGDVNQLYAGKVLEASSGCLAAKYDAATAYLKAPWRMPTADEFAKLIRNCDIQWVEQNGRKGCLVKGRGAYASKSIFLPAAGFGDARTINAVGSQGCYWSSRPTYPDMQIITRPSIDDAIIYLPDPDYYAACLNFSSKGVKDVNGFHRRDALSVRPVRGPLK